MKKQLRQNALLQRKTLNLKQISRQICENIASLPVYKAAKNIGLFYPKDVEISVIDLCKDASKIFYLPKVEGKNMVFYEFSAEKDLSVGSYGILEPKTNKKANIPDMIITPALMADMNGFRLGWGGGFYDRYLEKYTGIVVCPMPMCQVVEALPNESHDKKCNYIVTENKIIKIL